MMGGEGDGRACGEGWGEGRGWGEGEEEGWGEWEAMERSAAATGWWLRCGYQGEERG